MAEQALQRVVSVGSGTMGPGVAVDYLVAGHAVTIMGRDETKLTAARQKVEAALAFLAGENYLDAPHHQAALAHFSTAPLSNSAPLAEATIVVESITENLEVKQQFFGELEAVCSPQTLFFSNTSGLSISQIFAHLQHPARGMGTHYWNPPYLMPLVELTPGQQTDPTRLEEVRQLLESMGKKPVIVRQEVPGLIWNRLQFALLRECLHLLAEGVATAPEIDRVVEMGLARRASFMGLFKIADLGGGDVWYGIADYLFAQLSNATEPPALWREQIERGEFGLKSGQGFYNWNAEEARTLLAARDRYLLSKLKESR